MEQKIDVTIAGYPLTLKADVDEDEAYRIARFVDGKINDAMENNKRLSSQLAAILASVNIAGELFSVKKELEELREISREPMENFDLLSSEKERLMAENQSLQREIERLKDDLVDSLNTIGDINKRMTGAAQESEAARAALEEKQQEMVRVEQSLAHLQQTLIDMTKENAELKKSVVYNKGAENA